MFTTQALEKIQTSIQSASSPEDAAKTFHQLISVALAKEIGDALAKVRSQSIATNASKGTPIDGWEQFVTGCGIRLDWPTPKGTPIQIGTPIFYSAAAEAPSALMAGSISIGISFGC